MNGLLASMQAAGVGYFAARAAIALVLGAAIGLERQWRQRIAGLRTSALVTLGAALFETFAVLLSGAHGTDPTRVASYVVSGVGFLGAGVILRDGGSVRGINTAATIWCSSAVGVLAGAGYIPAAVTAAALVLVAHVGLRPVARSVDRLPVGTQAKPETAYNIRAVCGAADEARVRTLVVQALSQGDFELRSVRSENLNHGGGTVAVTADLLRPDRDDLALEAAASRLSREPSVSSVTWKILAGRRGAPGTRIPSLRTKRRTVQGPSIVR
jgi:putative Mg2+ transporter-C (MgtC) family protein